MDNSEDNKVNSKIEQIRLDLEKKLSSIENAKRSDEIKKLDKSLIDETDGSIKSEKTIEVVEEISDESINKLLQSKAEIDPVFEITEPIEIIKKEEIDVEFKENTSLQKAEIISDKNNIQPKLVSKIKKPQNIPQESIKEKEITPPPISVISTLNTESNTSSNSTTNDIEEAKKQNSSKKGIGSLLLYGFLILLFLGIGYLIVDYMNDRNSLVDEKINQKLIEFKNKRYLDSVELADLNNQLLDIQSKKLLDSIDRAYEKELLSKSKYANNKTTKKLNEKKQKAYNFSINTINKNKTDINNKSEIISNESSSQNTNLINQQVDLVEGKENKVKINETNKNEANKNEANKENNITEEQIKEKTNDIEEVITSTNKPNDENAKITTPVKTKVDLETNKKNTSSSINKMVYTTPVYPGCEKKKSELDRKKCLTGKMYKYVSRNFNTELAQNSGLKEGLNVVKVSFIIDKKGYATVLNVRAKNKKLESEAIRVIESLPKMIPGSLNGKNADLKFNIPIKFMVEN